VVTLEVDLTEGNRNQMGTDLIYSTGNSQWSVNLQVVTMISSDNEWEDFQLE
jgi:hypothetical protein